MQRQEARKTSSLKKVTSYVKSTVLSTAKQVGFFFSLHSRGTLEIDTEKEGKATEGDLDSKKVSHSGTPKTSSLGDTWAQSL